MTINHLRRTVYFLFMAVNLLLSCAPKNEIHLSPGGDDNASGTRNNPFETLERAKAEVREKARSMNEGTIRVILHEGVYPITQPLKFSAEDRVGKDVTIVWQAATGEQPIISGGKAFKSEGKKGEAISVGYAHGKDLFDIYVNEKRATRARTPNHDFFRFGEVKEEVLVQGEGRAPEKAVQTLTFPDEADEHLQELPDSALNHVRFHAFFKWDNTIRHLSGRGMDKNSYTTKGEGMKPWNSMGKGTRFFLENYRGALDAPSEWLASENTVEYIPHEEETTINNEVQIPVAEKWLVIEGRPGQKVNNLRFEGISFRYTNYTLPATGFEPAQAASTIDAAVMIDHAENIEFHNCEFAHTGQHGIWFRKGVTNSLMEQCHLHDLGAGGIRIGDTAVPEDSLDATGSIRINNCIVQSGGYNFPSAVGVWIGQSGNNLITHNDIADFRYTGVSVGWIWGYAHSPAKANKIKNNRIHHIGWALLSDMAAVYTLGKSEGTEVSHNVVHDIHAYSYGGWGLYTDEGSSYIKMENNLVYNTKTGGFHQHYGRENTIRNNIFAYADMYQVQATRVEDHLSFTFENNIVIGEEGVLLAGPWKEIQVNMDYNCYWYTDGKPFDFDGLDFESWKQQTGHDRHSIIADPGSIDLYNGTYQLQAGIAGKINFQVFNPNEAGVYGDEAWKQKARLNDSIIREFEEEVLKNKNIK